MRHLTPGLRSKDRGQAEWNINTGNTSALLQEPRTEVMQLEGAERPAGRDRFQRGPHEPRSGPVVGLYFPYVSPY